MTLRDTKQRAEYLIAKKRRITDADGFVLTDLDMEDMLDVNVQWVGYANDEFTAILSVFNVKPSGWYNINKKST